MTSKVVFQYDSKKYYVGSTQADESPLEPGVYLMPANCTDVMPTVSPGVGETLQWDGTTWNVVTAPKQLVANQSADYVADEKTAEDKLTELTAKFDQLQASFTEIQGLNASLHSSVLSMTNTIGDLNDQVKSLTSIVTPASTTTTETTSETGTEATTSDTSSTATASSDK